MKKLLKYFALFLLLSNIPGNNLLAQEEMIEPAILLEYKNVMNYGKEVTAKIYFRDDEGFHFLPDLAIQFYSIGEEEERLLGEVLTDADGIAQFVISNDYKLPKDPDGFFTIRAVFEGNNLYAYYEDEFSFKDIVLEMDLNEIDSVRTISLLAYERDSLDNKIAVEEADVYIQVPRMFTNLTVSEEYLEAGELEYEFTVKISGDSSGKIGLIAFIPEHELYGNVEIRSHANWGVPFHAHLRETFGRQLWTPVAPLWMIITLIILLAGVWGHYIYSIIQLSLIGKAGKKMLNNK
ncbi:MAG: hypothetical protein ISR55_03745 [Bacteroidetes bacterium]|nr:hypothetical protein [Bacteroidota bacterium]MBL6962910.1 hypothetical protein [Bacteroidota bacterium]